MRVSEQLPGRGAPETQEARAEAVRSWLDRMDAQAPEDRAINAELRRLMERTMLQPRLPASGPSQARFSEEKEIV